MYVLSCRVSVFRDLSSSARFFFFLLHLLLSLLGNMQRADLLDLSTSGFIQASALFIFLTSLVGLVLYILQCVHDYM